MLIPPHSRHLLQQLSTLVYTNPFLPERITLEKKILGSDYIDEGLVWSTTLNQSRERPNVLLLLDRIQSLTLSLRTRIASAKKISPDDARLYADLAQYLLYYRTWAQFDPLAAGETRPRKVPGWKNFAAEYHHFLHVGPLAPPHPPEHIFALCFQIRRAFHHIFSNIVGSSLPVAHLRAAVWQSIFTHNLPAYRDSLFQRMLDIPTLILGPSGTGKELVARAIALSRYIPFDPASQRFTLDPASLPQLFLPLNLSALAPTLIESELFGHRRGAFTGALEDRPGYLETCSPLGSVFLDEIGELDPQIQVKLLRVLQARTFQRLGEADTRTFTGKIIAATNRNLPLEMTQHRFRQDLYYRLCADVISTPSLAQQLAHNPEAELNHLVPFIAQRVAGPQLAPSLTAQTIQHITSHVGLAYPWPGNFRELEQCVRNILIRGSYLPPQPPTPSTFT